MRWGRSAWREPKGTRTLWNQPDLDSPEAPSNQGGTFKRTATEYQEQFIRPERLMVQTEAEANLVSSLTTSGRHMPVIDIDLPIRVVPSKTPGHSHLFIDVEFDQDTYFNLLRNLSYVGLVEENYVLASEAAGMSFVRLQPEKRPERGENTPFNHYRGF